MITPARIATILGYIGLIVGTNFLFATVGPVLITFVFAGLTLAARDFVHDLFGRRFAFGLIIVGAILSALLASPAVALASFVAFLLAETLDLAIYGPVKERLGRPVGIALSGTAGSILDSLVFLSIAFGSLAFFVPQVVGKVGATLGAALVVALIQAAVRRR